MNVLFGVFGQQIPIWIAGIAHFHSWIVAVAAERSRSSVFEIQNDNEVIDAIEMPFNLRPRRRCYRDGDRTRIASTSAGRASSKPGVLQACSVGDPAADA